MVWKRLANENVPVTVPRCGFGAERNCHDGGRAAGATACTCTKSKFNAHPPQRATHLESEERDGAVPRDKEKHADHMTLAPRSFSFFFHREYIMY